MGSSPEWTVPPHVGLTILLWEEINQAYYSIRMTFDSVGSVTSMRIDGLD